MKTNTKKWFDKNSEKIIAESAKIEGLTQKDFMVKLLIESSRGTKESNRLGSLLKKVGLEMLEKQTFDSKSVDFLVECKINECPGCGSIDIQEKKDLNFDDDGLWQEWSCCDCPATWEINVEVKYK